MENLPLVSVIIPAHNAETFIADTLASVQAQTYEALEVLVVDDGSTDRTPEIVRAVAAEDPRVTLLRQRNRGVAAARNLAIAHARGVYVAPLDADDFWYPRKIEAQVRRMEQGGASMGMVYTWWLNVEGGEHIRSASAPWNLEGDIYAPLLYINFVGNASVPLFRRRVLEQVGGYSTVLRDRGGQGCEDWDLALRVAERHDVGVAPGYHSAYRSVQGSMSMDYDSMARSYQLIMEGVQQTHPELSPALFRWSKANFDVYLAGMSYTLGHFGPTLSRMTQAVRADPFLLLRGQTPKLVLRCLVSLAARSAGGSSRPASGWGGGPSRWWVGGPPRERRTRAEIERQAVAGPPWQSGKARLYDRVRARRWRALTSGDGVSGAPAPERRRTPQPTGPAPLRSSSSSLKPPLADPRWVDPERSEA